MSDHSELKKLAKAATLGEWKAVDYGSFSGKSSHWYVETNAGKNVAFDDCGDPAPNHWEARGEQDMKFIAAANPTAVLELIDEVAQSEQDYKDVVGTIELRDIEIERLKTEVERLRTAEGDAMTYKAGMENCAAQRDELKAENKTLRYFLDRARGHLKIAGYANTVADIDNALDTGK